MHLPKYFKCPYCNGKIALDTINSAKAAVLGSMTSLKKKISSAANLNNYRILKAELDKQELKLCLRKIRTKE